MRFSTEQQFYKDFTELLTHSIRDMNFGGFFNRALKLIGISNFNYGKSTCKF